MAGHSKFKNIMHRKNAQDAKRGKVFTKVAREIIVAVKLGGDDAESNPRLRAALGSARAVNMPKDNVERAIKRALGAEGSNDYFEMRYEGYGPGGVAVIVDALTDNRNRTASEVRSAFSKYGGNLGETNSVSFQFDRIGLITYPATAGSNEEIFEEALEAGAEDVRSADWGHEIECSPDELHAVREELSKKFGDPDSAKLEWKPQNLVEIDEEKAKTLLKLIEVLEDNDDVQVVSSNFSIDDEILANL